MLDRAEDPGGTRIVNMARGSPTPARSSLRRSSKSTSVDYDAATTSRSLSEPKGVTGAQLLGSVGIIELLQQDDRPTFVIDVSDNSNFNTSTLQILYANTALTSKPGALAHVVGKSDDPTLMLDLAPTFAEFKSWVLAYGSDSDFENRPISLEYGGLLWTVKTIRKRLRVVCAQSSAMSQPEQDNYHRPSLQHYQGLASSSPSASHLNLKRDSPGYFDAVRSRHAGTETPGRMEALVMDSFPEDSPPSHNEEPTSTNGDIGIGELISGSVSPSTQQTTFPVRNNAEGFEGMSLGSISNQGFFDWTRLPLAPNLPTHIQFARSVNWAATSLGPIECWSADLRGMCNLIMASPHPAAMYWGKDHVAIYNEPYIQLAGQKHPSLMGMRYADAWSEIWEALEGVFINAHANAQATMKDDDCLFMQRNGFLEETYFSWSLIPLIGDDGTVVGTYNPAFEKTRRKIAERRMLTLREVGERTAAARHVTQFWSLVLEGLEYNEFDAPLVMVYSLQDDAPENDASSTTSSQVTLAKVCHLEGALGVSSRHRAAPASFELRNSTEGFGAAFRHALAKNKPIVLREEDGSLDTEIFAGIQWRGYGDPPRVVVVAPIQPTTGESTLGFLVMATNPRRPYDEDYDLFVQLLVRQLATSVASVVLFEEEIRKGEEAAKMAAQDRIELSNQLVARTQEAVESESKFTRMAELAPVGVFIGDEEGKIVFVNDAWYDITSFPRGRPVGNDWLDYVVEEDQAKAAASWNSMLTQGISVSLEFRYQTPWQDSSRNAGATWVLASASPEKDQDGKIKRVFGSITNISSQKFAEELQTRRMEEAVEMKRQQTNFIDITSHEMRNPLGAILLSSDEITASLSQLRNSESLTDEQRNILDGDIDAAQTITLCAQHQKRIVDDVLTLSKLDSAVLLVTPVDAQPIVVIQRALKIFEGELQSPDIVLDFKIDKSYRDCKVDWVKLDPFRLSQVLINLTTNAIKFTTTQEKRTILVHLAASTEKPSQEDRYGLTYIPSRAAKTRDITATADWGVGNAVYIHFAVQDTGRGLIKEEMEKLFQRFSQANPRTHVTYGGSGLGLFICRELVELQGGEIGVASESGKGSTFAFYVKARRSAMPPQGTIEEYAVDFMHSSGRKSSAKSTSIKIPLARTNAMHALQAPGINTTPLPPSQDGISPRTRTPMHPEAMTPTNVASPAEIAAGGVRPDQLKILIVEDNLINQKVLASQLRKLGCSVYVANHGREALDQIEASSFHTSHAESHGGVEISVVLMDLEMPVMDGMTAARTIRQMETDGDLVGHVPLIAVTANAREEQVRNCIEAGMDGVVSKPFSVKEIMGRIGEIVTKFQSAKDQAG